ncbi:MAG: protein kinase, partial [Planctomycetales bacterium]|nr:protein kinase [Planctomycetales bacterium]
MELLKIDLEYAWGTKGAFDAGRYRERFPGMEAIVDEAVEWGRQTLLTKEAFSTATDSYSIDENDDKSDFQIPKQIGQFEIRGKLGEGAFGCVFRAFDSQLNREVALKVAGERMLRSERSVEAILKEARASASLVHPGIVRIYEVQVRHTPPYIVQELIEGATLRDFMGQPIQFEALVKIVAGIADAVGYAHSQKLVHLDLKPGNVLIDKQSEPHVADFGLAVHESAYSQQQGRIAGTPAYMSPEQTRGETHRIDGRADIWAIGIILYEWMTGQRPFVGSDLNDLYGKIQLFEPRPPRQRNPSIPAELERITLKCIQKRADDRYLSVASLKDDLSNWLAESSDVRLTPTVTNSEQAKIKVIPKGLHSFDRSDHEFFCQLLPGPTDRNGTPENIRFWKRRIEECDSDATFPVGLLYGPSGCGKSSLVQAGLLPKLSSSVKVAYIECTAETTESHLLRSISKLFPRSEMASCLADQIKSVRENIACRNGQKLLIVLDQFEQWLSGNRNSSDKTLVDALRQCDGGSTQCLVMVRDDFYLAVNRFFRAIEVPLVEGSNCSLADLFELSHAENVLRLFGQAYGRLPDNGEVSQE